MSHRVVIVGGGFGGLYAAKALGSTAVEVMLIDRRNFHLFQPLLYQVATGGLSPGEIASPLRAVLNRHQNIRVIAAEVKDIVPDEQKVVLHDGEVSFDTLVVATGVTHDYFGNDHFAKFAPGLKRIEDALEIRSRVFLAFETAERELEAEARKAWMTFVIVGGGPTGVELAGALGELAHHTLVKDFRNIRTKETQILLIEAADRILPSYPVDLSEHARKELTSLGVTVCTNVFVTDVSENAVTVRNKEEKQLFAARTILWAAGVRASSLGEILAKKTGASLDRAGRVIVRNNLSITDHIFVIGDLANYTTAEGKQLPGLAPVAMQQGAYVARLILQRVRGKEREPVPSFRYRDKGMMAVIGRNSAVALSGRFQMHGFPAWIAWVLIHIYYLIEFDNKLLVLIQWAWNYFTRKRGARLITGEATLPYTRPL